MAATAWGSRVAQLLERRTSRSVTGVRIPLGAQQTQRNHDFFFRVKDVLDSLTVCPKPPRVSLTIRTHKNDDVRTLKIL